MWGTAVIWIKMGHLIAAQPTLANVVIIGRSEVGVACSIIGGTDHPAPSALGACQTLQ